MPGKYIPHPRPPRPVYVCTVCGASFTRPANWVAQHGARFCSRACASASFQRGETLTCAQCGKTFYGKATRARKYCSHECYAEAQTFDDRENGRGARYRQWRDAVYARDDRTCRRCGQQGEVMHAHHVKPWAYFRALRYDVSNGITLCKSCHRALHTGVPRAAAKPLDS